jgi:hypothetical protein
MQVLTLVKRCSKQVMVLFTCTYRACTTRFLPPSTAQTAAATHSHGSSCCGQPQAQQLAQHRQQHC